MSHQIFGPDGHSEEDRHRELTVSGPLIDIEIHGINSSFSGIAARGLIDTGASIVCIDLRTAKRLELKQINEDKIGVVGGTSVIACIFMGELFVPQLNFREIMPLYAVQMKQPSHSVLLGRSFLKNFIVTFDGPRGTFQFSTPYRSPILGIDDFAT